VTDSQIHQLAPGVLAWISANQSWGYSNAGLVGGSGASALIDTLFDLGHTAAMLDALGPFVIGAPIDTIINTHGNGDHCHGNQLLPSARVITSERSACEMTNLAPRRLHELQSEDLGADGNRFVEMAFGPFRFDDLEVPQATETFTSTFDVDIGGRHLVLEEVGPAHSSGDILISVPDASLVFAGDIVFVGATPVIWAGPVAGWIAACRRICELDPHIVVPGHGPLTDVAGVQALEAYLTWIYQEAVECHRRGVTALEAAWTIDLGPYRAWKHSERIVINVDAIYGELDPKHQRMDSSTTFRELGRYRFS
jgi:glyoxylase-like metal-dependent hydrolase (beta-lactamase superfamily II)